MNPNVVLVAFWFLVFLLFLLLEWVARRGEDRVVNTLFKILLYCTSVLGAYATFYLRHEEYSIPSLLVSGAVAWVVLYYLTYWIVSTMARRSKK